MGDECGMAGSVRKRGMADRGRGKFLGNSYHDPAMHRHRTGMEG